MIFFSGKSVLTQNGQKLYVWREFGARQPNVDVFPGRVVEAEGRKLVFAKQKGAFVDYFSGESVIMLLLHRRNDSRQSNMDNQFFNLNRK